MCSRGRTLGRCSRELGPLGGEETGVGEDGPPCSLPWCLGLGLVFWSWVCLHWSGCTKLQQLTDSRNSDTWKQEPCSSPHGSQGRASRWAVLWPRHCRKLYTFTRIEKPPKGEAEARKEVQEAGWSAVTTSLMSPRRCANAGASFLCVSLSLYLCLCLSRSIR